MPDTRIEAIRRFNRFYTRRIGVLHEGLLNSKFSLTESRLLWELAHASGLTATDLARTLELDTGYLSRLLTGLKQRGLIKGTRSTDDARQQHLALTAAGKRAFAPLDTRSRAEVASGGTPAGSPSVPTNTQMNASAVSFSCRRATKPRTPRSTAPHSCACC